MGLAERLMRLVAEGLVAEPPRAAVLEEAGRIHRFLASRGLYRGRERVSTALACLYAAARYSYVQFEPAEFLVLARRVLVGMVLDELRELGRVWRESGGEGAREYVGRIRDGDKRLVLRALRADADPMAPIYVHRVWGRRFLSAYSAIVQEFYGRSPPPVLPEHKARYYARWLRQVKELPEALEELAGRAARALAGRAAGRSARRVAFAGIIAASRLLGSPVPAEELAEVFGADLVGRSRPGLRELERLAEEALARLREDVEPRVVPQEAGDG
jgi:transcription initiation factor TFIIIB Brf1 subunit/transcription initiation factor TFIIB